MLALALRAALFFAAFSAACQARAQPSAIAGPETIQPQTDGEYPRGMSLKEIHEWIEARSRRRSGLSREDLSELAKRCSEELGSNPYVTQILEHLAAFARQSPPIMADFPVGFSDACVALLSAKDAGTRSSAIALVDPCTLLFPDFAEQAALPALAILNDPWQARVEAAGALWWIGSSKPDGEGFGTHAETVVNTLLPLVQDPESDIFREAARALGASGKAGRPAVAPLIEVVEGKKAAGLYHRIAAIGALAQLKEHAPEAVPVLRRLLREEEGKLKTEAISALSKMGSTAREAIPDFLELLEHSKGSTRNQASYAIGRFGSDAAGAVPRLHQILRDGPETTDRASAAVGLAGIGPESREAIGDLIAALDSSDEWLRFTAATALGAIGAESIAAVERIQKEIDADPEAYMGEGSEIIAKIMGEGR